MNEVKIKKIDVKNLKAVSEFTAFFDGKSAHVTGANGIGKSTVIRAMIDRLRGLQPSIITKIGEKQGKTVMELTDGCRFEWQYNDEGKDQLDYYTPASVKPVKREVFKHICNLYFPNQFDINKFLTTTEPRKRLQMISELVNVDLTEIQERYKEAFQIRRDAKRELKVLESQIKPKPEFNNSESSENLDIEQKTISDLKAKIQLKKDEIEAERNRLNKIYLENKAKNENLQKESNLEYQKLLDEWIDSEDKIEDSIIKLNDEQNEKNQNIIENQSRLEFLVKNYQDTEIGNFIDFFGIGKFIDELPTPEILKVYIQNPKPEPKELHLTDPMPSDFDLNILKSDLNKNELEFDTAINMLDKKREKLNQVNSSKQVFEIQLKQWNDFQIQVEAQLMISMAYEILVADILNEIKVMVSGTKLPIEFSIDLTDRNDILFRPNSESEFLPITNETLASSEIFIAAFKLQANYLDAFRVAHFDVSYLDYENRQKVLTEAIAMNIQLLTESPAYEEIQKELQYKITEL